MRITFAEHTIELRSWEQKCHMVEFLSRCEAGYILLGENQEQEAEFFSVTIYLEYAALRRFGIGICSQGHGILPCIFLQPEASRLVFGYNEEVVGVYLPDRTIVFSLSLDSLFHSFLPLYDRNMMLIFHEIGVVARTFDDRPLWNFSKDVITRATIEADVLRLEFMDSPTVHIKLDDGMVTDNIP